MPAPAKKNKVELKVFISSRDSKCEECGEELGRHAWITLVDNGAAVCLSCADLDHLVFLPSGDAALTRRSRKHSRLSAVVLKWSKARKRYERQGLLVENEALERAELDERFIARFSDRIREIFAQCPAGRERLIAEHACRKCSGRVGRSAAAKALDENAVRLAVAAHVRHAETEYDELLQLGVERHEARRRVQARVSDVLLEWANR